MSPYVDFVFRYCKKRAAVVKLVQFSGLYVSEAENSNVSYHTSVALLRLFCSEYQPKQ